ncbi:hypothetical protein BH10PLA2_BH10PLA2_35770 [soil metagenome]
MTLEKTLLRKVPEWRPTPGERATLVVSDESSPWSVRLTADRCEELGAALWELRLERIASPLALTHDQLTAWANRVVSGSALLDPLALIESDQVRRQAQIRSANPTERESAKLYYEILLAGTGQIDICRYQAKGSERKQIAFALTHECLSRLASQLTVAGEGL